jgi:hypothetical protein
MAISTATEALRVAPLIGSSRSALATGAGRANAARQRRVGARIEESSGLRPRFGHATGLAQREHALGRPLFGEHAPGMGALVLVEQREGRRRIAVAQGRVL